MNMVEKEKNMIDYAHKILAFKMNVAKSCKVNGIEPPTDEQLSEYINDYGLNVHDCVADYIEHEGMFRCLRTPFEEFKDEVNMITWPIKPTEEEMLKFFNENGNNIKLFCEQRIIKEMNSLERKAYFNTINKLTYVELVGLWNLFIEESAIYGADSCIYDLQNAEDYAFLCNNMSKVEWKEVISLRNTYRFITWTSLNDKTIKGKSDEDIKSTILAFWREIFERIILNPSCYQYVGEIPYFDEVVWPIIIKELGVKVDYKNGKVEYTK